MKIKISDNVLLIVGKDRGKSGKVIRVDQKRKKIAVEKLNLITKHIKKTKTSKGDKVRYETFFDVSNAMILCPHCSKPARIEYKTEGKTKSRICKLCKESVDQKFDSSAIKSKKTKKQS